MRILIAIDDYFNQSNGMCISTQRFVKEFKKMGHDIRIISRSINGTPDYAMPRLSVSFLNKLIQKEGFHLAWPIKNEIKKAVSWSDLVLIETPFPLCWSVSRIAHHQHKPIIGTFHIYPKNMTASIPLFNNRFWNWIFMLAFRQIAFKKCDALQCPTPKVKNWLQKHHFKQMLYVNSNGIAKKFIDNPHKTEVGHPFTILCIGRFSHEKRQETLFKALKLSKYQDQFQVVLAGQGPLKAKYQKLNQELTNPVKMRFYSQQDLLKLMQKSDLVIHCADVEIEGMSCMEAFSAGLVPIIADGPLSSTASYALTKYNKFPVLDSQDLAQKIDYWVTHPQQLKENSRQYRKFAKKLTVKKSAECAIKMMEKLSKAKRTH